MGGVQGVLDHCVPAAGEVAHPGWYDLLPVAPQRRIVNLANQRRLHFGGSLVAQRPGLGKDEKKAVDLSRREQAAVFISTTLVGRRARR